MQLGQIGDEFPNKNTGIRTSNITAPVAAIRTKISILRPIDRQEPDCGRLCLLASDSTLSIVSRQKPRQATG